MLSFDLVGNFNAAKTRKMKKKNYDKKKTKDVPKQQDQKYRSSKHSDRAWQEKEKKLEILRQCQYDVTGGVQD